MKRTLQLITLLSLIGLLSACACPMNCKNAQDDGWITLFDGESLDGWKASENTECFTVKDGSIVANGKRSHLFYDGPLAAAGFKNYELKVEVMARKNSNGGIYIHTEYQDNGWPAKGYEIQVNNTFTKDPRKTGSLYSIEDITEQLIEDNAWFTEHIIVKDKQITIKVNGKTTVDYTEPENVERPANMKGRILSGGTIALQGHDPGSTVYYRNIQIKPLP